MQQSVNREILIKYIHGECSQEELEQVRVFLLTPGHQDILDDLILEQSGEEWEELQNLPVQDDSQLSNWQAKFEQRKADQSQSITPELPQPKIKTSYMKYAAIWLVLMLGAAFYTMRRMNSNDAAKPQESAALQMKELNTKAGERATIALSDGTVIYLGPGSSLKYPEKFKGKDRPVSLTGEAFFEVAHNPARPFKIQSGKLTTTVLGTSFKVNAYKGHAFEVRVATGKVRVDRKEGAKMQSLAILTPGQQVKLKAVDDQPLLSMSPVSEILEWKKSKLIFRDNSLKEIAAELERAYDVSIKFQDTEKAKEILTVSLQVDVPLNKTLELLGKGANFKFRINGKQITIK